MLLDGLRIMVLGMGIVFMILIFLVISVSISAKVIHAFEGPPGAEEPPIPPTAGKKESHIAAVITAAVARFRRSK